MENIDFPDDVTEIKYKIITTRFDRHVKIFTRFASGGIGTEQRVPTMPSGLPPVVFGCGIVPGALRSEVKIMTLVDNDSTWEESATRQLAGYCEPDICFIAVLPEDGKAYDRGQQPDFEDVVVVFSWSGTCNEAESGRSDLCRIVKLPVPGECS